MYMGDFINTIRNFQKHQKCEDTSTHLFTTRNFCNAYRYSYMTMHVR